jgi:hypothetical protein
VLPVLPNQGTRQPIAGTRFPNSFPDAIHFCGLEKSQLSSQNITERPRFHARGHYQLNRARKILSIHELIANLNLRPKEKAATVGGLSVSIDTSPTLSTPICWNAANRKA